LGEEKGGIGWKPQLGTKVRGKLNSRLQRRKKEEDGGENLKRYVFKIKVKFVETKGVGKRWGGTKRKKRRDVTKFRLG